MMILALSPYPCQARRGRTRPMLQDGGSGSGIVKGGPAAKDAQPPPPDIATAGALAARALLAALLATRAPVFGHLHRLTITTRRPWGGLLRGRRWLAARGAQGIHPRWPRALVSPRRKVFPDGAFGPQGVWPQGPWAPGAVEGQESVDACAQVHRSRSPAGLRRGHKRRQARPWILG